MNFTGLMKAFFSFLIFLAPCVLHAQSAAPDLLKKKWNYIGIEEFSVVHAPDSAHKNDWLLFKDDGTYEWVQSGKTAYGVWKLNEVAKTISVTDSKTKKSLTYNLKNLTATDLTIEYQSPDLVRTKYRYAAAK